VLAEDVIAPHAVPPFANSGMDGFAVRSADVVTAPVDLTVVEDVAAGSVPSVEVAPGTAIKIMTGAPMPVGADSVVIVEDSESIGPDNVRLLRAAIAGQHIRRAGGDFEAGSVVLAAGTRLSATHLGVLASVGVSEPTVCRRPVVAVVSTGDELVSVDGPPLRPGSIRDSNRPLLVAALEELGVDVIDLGIVPDDERLLRSALGEAASRADAVVTSGGVSMGEYDLVKQVLTEAGTIEFWRVAMQPAKPFAFGFLDGTPLFGLPGNPVSVFVAFEQFLRPALLHRMGARWLFRPRTTAILGEGITTNPDKTVFVRIAAARQDAELVVAPSGGQGSNVMGALAAADGFGVVPIGTGDIPAGGEIEVEWFRAPERRTYQEVLGDG
jgi:molybdenum cofactor synthesis domain-containing protein